MGVAGESLRGGLGGAGVGGGREERGDVRKSPSPRGAIWGGGCHRQVCEGRVGRIAGRSPEGVVWGVAGKSLRAVCV